MTVLDTREGMIRRYLDPVQREATPVQDRSAIAVWSRLRERYPDAGMRFRSEDPRGRIRWPAPRRWLEYLLAISAGNALYFLVLVPRVPAWLVHQPFRPDLGLLLDFALCVLIYGIGRALTSRWEP